VEAAHARYALTRSAAALALCSFCAFLEAGACTCAAFDKRGNGDVLFYATRGVEEGDVGLDFDVFADEDFFLKWVSAAASAASSSSASKGAKEVFEVYVLEPTCALCAAEATESSKSASASKGVSAWSCACVGVEAAI